MTAAAAAGALVACTRPAPVSGRPVELELSPSSLAQNPELGLSAEQADRVLKAALEAGGAFHAGPATKEHLRIRIEQARRVLLSAGGGTVSPSPDREMAEVALSAELSSEGTADRLQAEGAGHAPLSAGAVEPSLQSQAYEAALGAAAREAVHALDLQLRARAKSDEALIRDLTAPDPQARDYAIRTLSDRRNPAAVQPLIERLTDESPVVVLRAVGALVAIGDRRAVAPLIDLTRRKPPSLVVPIAYALGDLGGPDAEAFLYTLESGSAEEPVRLAAHEALTELRRHQAEAVEASRAGEATPAAPRRSP